MRFENLHNINTSGLHSFRIDLEDEKAVEMIITISDDLKEIASCTSPFHFEKAQIIFFTQLVPNGNYNIECKVISTTGGTMHKRNITMLVYNTDNALNQKVTQRLKNNNAPVLKAGRASMRYLDELEGETLTAWFNQPNSEEFLNIKNNASPNEKTLLSNFVNDGYAIVENLLTKEELSQLNADLDEVIESGYQGYVKGKSQKLTGVHIKYASFQQTLRHPKVYELLRFLFQTEPLACQSLTFVCGSQQLAHQDASFLTPFPAGYMCGVWIALEDIQPNSGELFYFKKSHLANRYVCPIALGDDQYKFAERLDGFKEEHRNFMDTVETQYPQKEYFRAKAGDALIWHEVLLHGGAPRIDEFTTRKSIVCHYFADGAIALFDDRGVVPRMNNRYGLS